MNDSLNRDYDYCVLVNPSEYPEIYQELLQTRFSRQVIVFESSKYYRSRILYSRFKNCNLENFLILDSSLMTEGLKHLEAIGSKVRIVENYQQFCDLLHHDGAQLAAPPNMDNHSERVLNLTSKIGVLIRQWDAYDLSAGCISSLLEQDFEHYQLYILDDASKDLSPLFLFLEFPTIVVIPLVTRAEYCLSFNVLADYATRDHCESILVINNDTKNFSQSMLGNLQKSLAKPSVGIVSPQVLNFDGQNTHWRPRSWLGIPFNLATEGYLTSVSLWNKVGGFNNSYFRYCEDLRICKEIAGLGLEQELNTEVSFMHLGNGSSRKMVFIPIFFYVRNLVWIQRQYRQKRFDSVYLINSWKSARKQFDAKKPLISKMTSVSVGVLTAYSILGLAIGYLTSEKPNSSTDIQKQLLRTRSKWRFFLK